jgi:hypothetical protein
MATRSRRAAKPDLLAEVAQSSSDKLLSSVSYPLKAVERWMNFPGCARLAKDDDAEMYTYSTKEKAELLAKALEYVKKGDRDRSNHTVYDGVYSFGGSMIEQHRRVLDALEGAGNDYEGPPRKELQNVLDGGISGLVKTIGDWDLIAWCNYLRVVIKKQPSITLASPRIDLKGVSVNVTAGAELWAKYPWWNCHNWCFKWEKVIKCDRIASITVSIDLAADAHADVNATGPLVAIQAAFDRLRLDYPILDKIPLEGIANAASRFSDRSSRLTACRCRRRAIRYLLV